MLLGVQLIGVLFALFMLYITFLHRKRNEFTLKETTFWFCVWVIFMAITLFPSGLNNIVSALALARAMDFFIVLGFIFLLGLTFYNYTLLRRNQNKVEDVVRAVAIDRVTKGEKNGGTKKEQ